MTTNDYTGPESETLPPATLETMIAEEETPKRSQDETEMLDRMKDADDAICIYANNSGGGNLPGAAEALYIASTKLIQDDDTLHKRVGYVMALDALLAAPDAVQQALRNLRQALVDSDPGLALMGSPPVPPELVTPRYHQINGSTFFIDHDGNLSIDEREGRRPLIKLTPQEAYGMLTFMRLPGTAQLIERIEAQEQDRLWHDFESEEREEMTRKQAYDLLAKDVELMRLMVERLGQDFVITPRDTPAE